MSKASLLRIRHTLNSLDRTEGRRRNDLRRSKQDTKKGHRVVQI